MLGNCTPEFLVLAPTHMCLLEQAQLQSPLQARILRSIHQWVWLRRLRCLYSVMVSTQVLYLQQVLVLWNFVIRGEYHLDEDRSYLAQTDLHHRAVSVAATRTTMSHNDENDSDLAQAIAFSLRDQQSHVGTQTRHTDAPEGQQPHPDAHRRSTARNRLAVPVTTPLCGDCQPPASWQPRFGRNRCSRCNTRADVIFQPSDS